MVGICCLAQVGYVYQRKEDDGQNGPLLNPHTPATQGAVPVYVNVSC